MNTKIEIPFIALREWATTIEALGTGKQLLVMRKGGIHEETKRFSVQSDWFYLFPSFEHQKEELLKPAFRKRELEITPAFVDIKYCAHCVEDLMIWSDTQLELINHHHIWMPQFAEARLKWKKKDPLHLLLLRVYRLDESLRVELGPEHQGCKSWLNLPEAKPFCYGSQVKSDQVFQSEVNEIKKKIKVA